MPKQLHELNRFNTGIALNSDERDVEGESAAYSLNISPITKDGVLDSIKNDKFIFSSSSQFVKVLEPYNWARTEAYTGTWPTLPLIDDFEKISPFLASSITFIGTQGYKEKLLINGVEPRMVRLWSQETKRGGINYLQFRPSTAISETATTIKFDENIGKSSIQETAKTSKNIKDILKKGDYIQLTSGVAISDLDVSSGTATVTTSSDHGFKESQTIYIEASNTAYNEKVVITVDSSSTSFRYTTANSNVADLTGTAFSYNSIRSSESNGEIIRLKKRIGFGAKFEVERGALNSIILPYTANTQYSVFGNRYESGGTQYKSKQGWIDGLANWNKWSGNNIKGNSSYLSNANNTNTNPDSGSKLPDIGSYLMTWSNSNKTLTHTLSTGLKYVERNFPESSKITFYASEDDKINSGETFTLKHIKTGASYDMTFKEAPTDSSETDFDWYLEANLLKNHTFHHAVDTLSAPFTGGTDGDVGVDKIYRANDWMFRRLTMRLSDNTNTTVNNAWTAASDVATAASSDVVLQSSGGYWESTYLHITNQASNYYPYESSDKYMQINSTYDSSEVYLNTAITADKDDNILYLSKPSSQVFGKGDIIYMENGVTAVGSLTFISDTVANYDQDTITIVSTDGTSKVYEFDDDSAIGATGELSSVAPYTNVAVQLTAYSTPSAHAVADEFISALNSENGHGADKIIARKVYNTGTTNVVVKLYQTRAGTDGNTTPSYNDAGAPDGEMDVSAFANGANTGGTKEYMKVLSVNNRQITVERGYHDSPISYHYASDANYIYKNFFNSITQIVPSTKLKKGQRYNLSFYAKQLGIAATAIFDIEDKPLDGTGLAITDTAGRVNRFIFDTATNNSSGDNNTPVNTIDNWPDVGASGVYQNRLRVNDAPDEGSWFSLTDYEGNRYEFIFEDGTFDNGATQLIGNPSGATTGDDLITNGTFDTDSDWDLNSGWVINTADGIAIKETASANSIRQDGILTVGKTYRIKVDTQVDVGTLTIYAGSGASATAITSTGTHQRHILCASSTDFYFMPSSDFLGSIDNVSCIQVNNRIKIGRGTGGGSSNSTIATRIKDTINAAADDGDPYGPLKITAEDSSDYVLLKQDAGTPFYDSKISFSPDSNATDGVGEDQSVNIVDIGWNYIMEVGLKDCGDDTTLYAQAFNNAIDACLETNANYPLAIGGKGMLCKVDASNSSNRVTLEQDTTGAKGNRVISTLNYTHETRDTSMFASTNGRPLSFTGGFDSDGGLLIEVGGGYIQSDGTWIKPNPESDDGFGSTKEDASFQKYIIPIGGLNGPNNDTNEELSTVWRKRELSFEIPSSINFLDELSGDDAGLRISFISRGPNGTALKIDLADLCEETIIAGIDKQSIVSKGYFIDNKGLKDLIFYDSKENKVKVVQNFDSVSLSRFNFADVEITDNLSDKLEAISESKDMSLVLRNRAAHMGFGPNSDDSLPKWIGYLNHQLFDKKFENILYADNDYVPQYGEEGGGYGSAHMNKICPAGEYEQITATIATNQTIADSVYDSTNKVTTMAVTHNCNSDYRFHLGDNITVREYMDSDMSWPGKGVWVIYELTSANAFKCLRYEKRDALIIDSGSVRIAFRPYYYYGCVRGQNRLARINPADRLDWIDNEDGLKEVIPNTEDFKAGNVTLSQDLDFRIESISTFYNKASNGSDGGHIWALPKYSNSSDVTLFKISVEEQGDNWNKDIPDKAARIQGVFRSYKFSNISVGTHGKGSRYPSKDDDASRNAYIDNPSGYPSDILETKGTAELFDPAETDNTAQSVGPGAFDTRLWIQFHHSGGVFGDPSRFLFCGRTAWSNTKEGITEIHFADRTPPMTHLYSKKAKYTTDINNPTQPKRLQYSSAPFYGYSQAYDSEHNDGLTDEWKKYTSSRKKMALHAIYNNYPDNGNESTNYIEQIGIVKDNDGEDTKWGDKYTQFLRSDEWTFPYFNFGWNVGWKQKDKKQCQLRLPKYGLFQIADNDGDGIIDGTGLITLNKNTDSSAIGSETDQTENRKGKYGGKHQRVCSHVVGLLASAKQDWIKHSGRLHVNPNINTDGKWLSTLNQESDPGACFQHDAPEYVNMEKFVAVCSDIHFGDYRQPHRNQITDIITAYSGRMTQIKTKHNHYLQAGDLIYLDLETDEHSMGGDDSWNYDNWQGWQTSVYIAEIRGDKTLVIPIRYSGDYKTNEEIASKWPFLYVGGFRRNAIRRRHPNHGINVEYDRNDEEAEKGLGLHPSARLPKEGGHFGGGMQHYHWAWDSDDHQNGDVFRDTDRAAGHYSPTWFSQQHNFGPADYEDTGTHGMLFPGFLNKVERLSALSGKMFRPFSEYDQTFEKLIIGDATVASMPCFPDAILHKGTHAFEGKPFNIAGCTLTSGSAKVTDMSTAELSQIRVGMPITEYGKGHSTDGFWTESRISQGAVVNKIDLANSFFVMSDLPVNLPTGTASVEIRFGGHPMNQYASRLFIACKSHGNERGRVFSIDWNLMIPDKTVQRQAHAASYEGGDDYDSGDWKTNDTNKVHMHQDYVCSGVIHHYFDKDVDATNTTLNDAGTHPVVEIYSRLDDWDRRQDENVYDAGDIGIFKNQYGRRPINTVGDGQNFTTENYPKEDYNLAKFNGRSLNNSYYRIPNVFHGMWISVIDRIYGFVQTRKILGSWSSIRWEKQGNIYDASWGVSQGYHKSGDNHQFAVHFPFGHPPETGDRFYIWEDSSVCVSPLQKLNRIGPRRIPNTQSIDINDRMPSLAESPFNSGTPRDGWGSHHQQVQNTSVSIPGKFNEAGERFFIRANYPPNVPSDEALIDTEASETRTGFCTFYSSRKHFLVPGDDIIIFGAAEPTVTAFGDLYESLIKGRYEIKHVPSPFSFVIKEPSEDTNAYTGKFYIDYQKESRGRAGTSNPAWVNMDYPTIMGTYGGLGYEHTKNYGGWETTLGNVKNNIRASGREDKGAKGEYTLSNPHQSIVYDLPPGAVKQFLKGQMITLKRNTFTEYNSTSTIIDSVKNRQYGYGTSSTTTSDNSGTDSPWDNDEQNVDSVSGDNAMNLKKKYPFGPHPLKSKIDGKYQIYDIDEDTNQLWVNNELAVDVNFDNLELSDEKWDLAIASQTGSTKFGHLKCSLEAWDRSARGGSPHYLRSHSFSSGDVYSYSYHVHEGDSLGISAAGIADEPGNYFKKNTTYEYKIALMYDGYQEGPLSSTSWIWNDAKAYDNLTIKIALTPGYSNRLTHIQLYRRKGITSAFKHVKEISTDSGAGWAKKSGKWVFAYIDDGKIGAAFETRTGFNELVETVKIKYGLSTQLDGFLFVGDCSHDEIDDASTIIFRSKPGQFSVFDWTTDYINIPFKPTALTSFNGRLFVFDNNNIYKINQHDLIIEDVFEGIGCIGPNSLIVTEYGMFFADRNGAYMHNGSSPIRISEAITAGGDTNMFSISDSSTVGSSFMRDISWQNTVSKESSIVPYVRFDSKKNSVLFFVEKKSSLKETHPYISSGSGVTSTVSSALRNKSFFYCWSYNLVNERWDLWEVGEGDDLGVPFLGDDGKIYVSIDSNIYEFMGGTGKRDYTWLSKKLTMGASTQLKVFNKIKITGSELNQNSGGEWNDSSDKLILATNTGRITSGSDGTTKEITFLQKENNSSEYKLRGSNKTGKWIQILLENQTDPIESIGIIFRKRAVK